MPPQGAFAARDRVPDLDRAVLVARGQRPAVGGEGRRGDLAGMPPQGVEFTAGGRSRTGPVVVAPEARALPSAA